MVTIEDELGRCPAKRTGHLPRAAVCFILTMLLAACGGGGGGDDGGGSGGGGGGGGGELPEALTFLEPDTFANGRVYETASGSIDFLGSFRSAFIPAQDCTISSNFTPRPFLGVRWRNLATNESGTGNSTIACVDNGIGGAGVRTRWLTDYIGLASGQNIIQFDVIDDGVTVGRNRVTVNRVDTQAPTVLSVSPAAGSEGVATNSPVVVVFSEAMNQGSLVASRLTVTAADGTAVTGAHSYDADAYTWKFQPASLLAPGVAYSVWLSGSVEDESGLTLGSDVEWQFTTGTGADVTGPAVVATWPAASCQCSPPTTRVMLEADELLDPVATMVVTDSQQNPVAGELVYFGRVLEFVPDNPLSPNETYSVTADGMRDSFGNTAPATTWEFGTNDGLLHGTWEELAAPPTGLSGVVVASDNTYVFAFGNDGINSQFKGYYYQPSADQWQNIADLVPLGASSPEPRLSPTVIWDGTEFLVYGGFATPSSAQDDGGAYQPATDTWRNLSGSWWDSSRGSFPQLLGLGGHSAIWTGTEMLIWGGLYDGVGDPAPTNRGWTYNPSSDAWDITGPEPTVDDSFRLLPDDTAPTPRSGHDAVWIGSEMIVWGGVDASGNPVGDGGRYDPATDTWQPVAVVDALAPAPVTEALWTGIEMLAWNGGRTFTQGQASDPMRRVYLRGYDPLTDSWRRPVSAWEPEFLPDTPFFMLHSGSTAIAIGIKSGTPFQRTLAAYSLDTATDQWRSGNTLDVPFCDIDSAALHQGQVYVSCNGRIYRFAP